MDMSNFRPELHVAQQSRRDKLRIQHDSNPPHYQFYANNLQQLPPHDALNYESNNLRNCRPGNICYDPSDFCSEMPNFSMNSQGMLAQKDAMMVHQEPDKRVGETFCGSLSRTIPNTFNPSATISSDPQYFTTWKSIGSQSSSDWVANQNPIFVGEGLSGSSLRIINSCTPISTLEVKPYLGYQELHPPLNNPTTEVSNPSSQNKHYGDMHCSSSLYQNAFQELVTAPNNRSSGVELRQKSSEETSHGPWVVGGGELLLLPAYADQLRLKSVSESVNRPADGCNQWSGELDYAAAKNADNSNNQALSLSLSSVPPPKVHATHIADRDTAMDLHCTDICAGGNVQGSRTLKPENLPSNPNLSTGVKVLGNVRQDAMAIPALTHRNPGPLGPFTGYATILRSSKYLRPAQQLLDELCIVARPKHIEICDGPEKILEEVRVSSDAVSNAEVPAITGDSSGSSFVFNASNDKGRDPEGASCSTDSYRPENLQKKAKLMYMLDEVCKRYKQYQQQMQMVVSSFESVAGLSAATPYVSLALKMVSKHFRCLKSAIADSLKSIINALGEDLSSPTAGTSTSKSKSDAGVSMLKFFDQSFQKQKGAAGLGILEGQHIWRPQRGLPERAVSILRAWLFDHFLHPYPTDTDKHMLAAQTGLTRNQVSNWFINARVRVWKPMVEEIHMLETKGLAADTVSSDVGKTNGMKAAIEGCDQANKQQQVECSSISLSGREIDRLNANTWNQEKRSRIEYHVPSSVDGSLMGLVPSHRSGVEFGGLGAVSLTLGLRQSAENAQRPSLQQEHHLRPHFGGQIIRDFVG